MTPPQPPPALPPELARLVERTVRASGLEGAPARTLENDLRAHFEDGLEAGIPAAALASRFGDPEATGRAVGEIRGRGRGGTGTGLGRTRITPGLLLEELRTGIRQAVRSLLRTPGFTAVVVCTLALGVGANTAVFSVLDAVLLEPLPYPEADRLVRIHDRIRVDGAVGENNYLRAPIVWNLREWDELFEGVGAFYSYRELGADLAEGDRADRLVTARVGAGFFEVLRVPPMLGRSFLPEESYGEGEVRPFASGGVGAPVAILSHALWQGRFGGDPGVLGRSIRLDGVTHEVVGVMPDSFVHPLGPAPDLWLPLDLRTGSNNDWSNFYLSAIGRLRGDLSLDAARGEVERRVAQLAEAVPDAAGVETVLEPLQADLVGPGRRALLWILTGAVALVLLSACVNVANLVLTRTLGRRRELAVRGALGSGRARLVVHLVLEGAVLAAAGGAVGLALGLGAVQLLPLLAADTLPGVASPGLSVRVFLFALGTTGLALLLFGLAPALHMARIAPGETLRGGGGGRGGTEGRGFQRVRNTLAVAQVGLAVVLVIGAGLLVRSFDALRNAPLGVDPDPVLTWELHLPDARYPDGALRHDLHERLLAAVSALPGVEAAGATSWLPVRGRFNTWGIALPDTDRGESPWMGVDVRIVAGDYFRAMGIPLLRGDHPSRVDTRGEAVIWLSESTARALFGERNPVGERVEMNAPRRVVGVVGDVAHDPRGETARQVFIPHAQYADNRSWALTQGDLRAQDRFAMILMGIFAALAALLAGLGTYAVLSEGVAARHREIGIRMALGADPGEVRGMILRGAGVLVLLGATLGVLAAAWTVRFLAPLLFRVPELDPASFALGTGVVVAIGLLAGWLPSRRATRVDPVGVLSRE